MDRIHGYMDTLIKAIFIAWNSSGFSRPRIRSWKLSFHRVVAEFDMDCLVKLSLPFHQKPFLDMLDLISNLSGWTYFKNHHQGISAGRMPLPAPPLKKHLQCSIALRHLVWWGVHKWENPNTWMVYNGRYDLKWMIWRSPHFRKPPNGNMV